MNARGCFGVGSWRAVRFRSTNDDESIASKVNLEAVLFCSAEWRSARDLRSLFGLQHLSVAAWLLDLPLVARLRNPRARSADDALMICASSARRAAASNNWASR